MSVEGLDTVAVIDHDLPAIPAGQARGQDHAIGGGAHRLSEASRYIDSRVEGALTVERVLALTEGAGDRADDRPQRRRIRHVQPAVAAQRAEPSVKGAGKAARKSGAAQQRELIEGF